MPTKQTKKPAAGGDSSNNSIMFILAYLLTWLTGLFVYFTEGQKDKRLKFHAVQAILLGIAVTVVYWILLIIPFLGLLSSLVLFLGWLYGMYVGWQASMGNDIEIPTIGRYAKQYSS